MFAALAALALFAPAVETYDLIPTDDVWVYPHASDPSKDPYLRVWGNGSSSVDRPGQTPEEHSYSYLRFDLSPLPKQFKLTGATLVLWHTPDPGWSAALTKAAPLEVRALIGDFSERAWRFEDAAKVRPDPAKEGLLGAASPELGAAGKELRIEVPLAGPESKLGEALRKALQAEKPFLALALTSKLDPSVAGQGGVYRVFSKDGPPAMRPVLNLSFSIGIPPNFPKCVPGERQREKLTVRRGCRQDWRVQTPRKGCA